MSMEEGLNREQESEMFTGMLRGAGDAGFERRDAVKLLVKYFDARSCAHILDLAGDSALSGVQQIQTLAGVTIEIPEADGDRQVNSTGPIDQTNDFQEAIEFRSTVQDQGAKDILGRYILIKMANQARASGRPIEDQSLVIIEERMKE